MPLQTHSYFTLPWLAMTPLARWHFWSSDHNVMVAGPKGKILTKGFLSPFIYNSQCQSMGLYYLLFNGISIRLQRLPCVKTEWLFQWWGRRILIYNLPCCKNCGPMVISNHKFLSIYLSYKGRSFFPIYV